MASDPKETLATKTDVTADPTPPEVTGAGTATVTTAEGDPTNPDAPPYAVHKGPDSRAANREAKRLAELHDSTTGDWYIFGGAAKGDGTTAVKTHYGELNDHTPIKLPDDEVSRLKSYGFKVKKVDAPTQ